MPFVERMVRQIYRRIEQDEAVPAGEEVVSLFESNGRIIRRGKAGKPTEFGGTVWLDEVNGGINSRYPELASNPPDPERLRASLARHQRLFRRAPHTVAGDRGGHSRMSGARQLGTKRVALPKPGAQSPERRDYERQGWFRRARRFRAGAEGRISVFKRRGYLGRCRDHGKDGFGRWVAWGGIAAKPVAIARKMGACCQHESDPSQLRPNGGQASTARPPISHQKLA